MSAKSQFLATNGGLTEGDNLLGSITLAFKDTRNGFDAQTKQLVEQLGTYADSTSNGRRFEEYVAKITPETKTTVAPRAGVKFGSGM